MLKPHLVLAGSREDVLDSQLPGQKLREDGEVVLAGARGTEHEGASLVLTVVLQGEILQLLSLVHLLPGVRERDLVREVGGLAVAERQSDAS